MATNAQVFQRADENRQRLLVLHNGDCLVHETVELLGSTLIPALDSPRRLQAILSALRSHPAEFEVVERPTLPDGLLLPLLESSHDRGYIRYLQTIHSKWVADGLINEDGHVLPECFRTPSKHLQLRGLPPREPVDPFARTGFYAFDMSTGICKNSWASIAASASLASDAVKLMLSDRRDVLALCRPPGHHCPTDMAGGYCYVNNVVVAVTSLRSQLQADGYLAGAAAAKIAILDLDFHHGNGTQDFFYEDATALYVSIHGENEYPYYTGFGNEIGFGAGEGLNLNLPLKTGSGIDRYLDMVDMAVGRIVEYEPNFLVLSLGFDTYKGDPLGYFMIETEDYGRIAGKVRQEMSFMTGVPAVILLEGGYVIDSLGDNMVSFLRGWRG